MISIKFILYLFVVIILIACQSESIKQDTTGKNDGQYDSEFPVLPTSSYIEEISESVYLTSIMAFYQSHFFSRESRITEKAITGQTISKFSQEKAVFDQPSAGTSILVYHFDDRIAFLTCAHVVNFPDTILSFYQTPQNTDSEYLKSIFYKVRQTNNIIKQPVALGFEIIALDEENDLALIGKKISTAEKYDLEQDIRRRMSAPLRVLTVTHGQASDLQWGSFVYILGFPQARKMVSTAIVSSPDYDDNHSFILDAALQKGISGGIVLALRDGVPNFEWVGMTKGISGKTEFQIVPDLNIYLSEWDLYKPYNGQIFLERRDIPAPGITYATGIETILDFMAENDRLIREKGYNPEMFFKQIN